jgi:ABC-type transport system involved in multi-copper enzyme maturation permease subunit
MDSGDSSSKSGTALMPALAILQYELGSLWSGWLVRLWLIAAGLFALLSLAASWGQLQTAVLIGSLLFPFLVFPWFLIVVLLGISPVTGSRLDALADGILSRPITRHEYLLASWAARVLTVLAVFFLVVTPCVILGAFAKRPVAADTVTWYGAICAAALVSLVLTFLVSLGFLAGTLLRRPLVAAVVLIFLWYPINFVLHTFSLEEFSPISLNQALPTLLRTPWSAEEEGTEPQLSSADAEAMARQASQFLSILSGSQPQPPPRESGDFFQRGNYEDFSFWKVFLGYSIPTLAAVGLATWCFCRRDL